MGYITQEWLPADWGIAVEANGGFGERDDPRASQEMLHAPPSRDAVIPYVVCAKFG